MDRWREHKMSLGWIGAALALPMLVGAMNRQMPNEQQRLRAMGPTNGLPATLQRALDPTDHFEPLSAPGPSDWLAAPPETSHMFGLMHCVYYRCVFNGSNHLAESDARPMHECPVDLRKLHGSIGFDVARRHATLHRFYRKVGFDDEALWTSQRLAWIVGNEEAKRIMETAEKGTKPWPM